MSLPIIKIVDVQHNDAQVDIKELTRLGLDILIYDCEELLQKLKDAAFNAANVEGRSVLQSGRRG